jgi:hypothetical protein
MAEQIDLQNITGKTIIVGISYYDLNGDLLEQKQLAGKVHKTTSEDGITLQDLNQKTEFTIPSDLSPWFTAPQGDYKDPITKQNIANPDYLVTWDVFKTKENTPEGDHEWWEWRPQINTPTVG